jgi:hypothetical protein
MCGLKIKGTSILEGDSVAKIYRIKLIISPIDA